MTGTPHIAPQRLRAALSSALLLLFSPHAHAALLRGCEPSDSALLCRMRSVLTLLNAAAVLLGLVLLVAILAAVRAYRRKPRKLTLDDINTDTR